VAAVRHDLGLDRPLSHQYVSFLGRLVHGNLGYSYTNSEPVTSLIRQALAPTLSLVLGGAALWLLLGVSAGMYAAVRRGTFADRATTAVALLFYSMPTFLLGELLLLFLFYDLHRAGIGLFPAAGYVPLTEDPLGWLQHMLLPWITIALVSAATYARLTRAVLLDVLGADYIRTARAKGLSERRVTRKHGLRAALAPVITQFGLDLGTLLGGAVVTETIFGLPGLGQLMIVSIDHDDLPTTIGLALLASVFVIVANIVVDFLYAVLDPRVSTE
jgi:peptide/nickel transport system permease protein